jgi:hypothetical protein
MKLWLPRRRIWRVAIYLVSLGLFLTAADLVLVQWLRGYTPGFETTRIVGPLQADGTIDYLAAMEEDAGAGVTRENNAAVPILQALGRQAIDPKQPHDGVTNRLGMAPLPDNGDYFVSYADFCKSHLLTPDQNASTPGEPAMLESGAVATPVSAVTRQWIEANRKPLDALVEGSKRPRFFMPLNCGYRVDIICSAVLAYVDPMRWSQRALVARSLVRLDAGEVDGFRSDLLAAHRVARLLGQGMFMVDRAEAGKMEICACLAGRVGATTGKLSRDQARALADDLVALGDLPPELDPMGEGERFIELDALQYLAKIGPARTGDLLVAVMQPHDAVFEANAFLFTPLAYERMMRGVNHLDDGVMAAAKLPTYPKRIAALELRDRDFKGEGLWNAVSGIVWGEWPVKWFVPPGMMGPTCREFQGKMEMRLTWIALELSAYKADHGAYPQTLTELSPGYLREVPVDLFSEKPLNYSRQGGGYLLYSVGPNMADDGASGDDLVVRVP